MALSALQIFKHLPGGKKTKEANCKQCGLPTCMAFAMKLAKGQVDIKKCPFISEELKNTLTSSLKPKQLEITFGHKDNPVKIGGEKVVFRHQKTFVNPVVIAVSLNSDDVDFEKKLNELKNWQIERVGDVFKIEVIEIEGDKNLVEKTKLADEAGFGIILKLASKEVLEKAKEIIKPSTAIITPSNDKILHASGNSIFYDLTKMRIGAIEEGKEEYGYPTIAYVDNDDAIAHSAALVCKYADIIVFKEFNPAIMSAIFTLRQGIYTDPQKPLQVEAGLYPIGEPDENSPLFVTTNFAITYFSVLNELEAAGKSAYLLITQSDGMSVLTAWSASKFTGEIIAKAVKDADLDNILAHKNLILPGLVASLKEELKYDLPDWNIIIGADDACDIAKSIKLI